MKITSLTPETFEALKTQGVLSDHDIKTYEAYRAKMVAKPSKPVPEVDITVPFVRGRFGERSFTAKTMDGKNGKFVSIRVPANVSGASAYLSADTLDKFIEGLIEVREGLAKANYPFPAEG